MTKYSQDIMKKLLQRQLTITLCKRTLLHNAKVEVKNSHFFQPYSGWTFLGLFTDEGWGSKRTSLPKLCHTYTAMMKIGTVIPYLKRIQKMYESRDTSLEFC